MIDPKKYRGKSINLTRNGYAPRPTKEWMDGWTNRYSSARILFELLLDLTPYKDSDDWMKGVLEVSMADLTKELGWGHNRVDKCMQTLYDDGIITWCSNRGRDNSTTITFCDWDSMFMNMSKTDNFNPMNMSEMDKLNPMNMSEMDKHIVLPSSTPFSHTKHPCEGAKLKKTRKEIDKFIYEDLGIYENNIIDLVQSNIDEVVSMRDKMVSLGGYSEQVNRCNQILANF